MAEPRGLLPASRVWGLGGRVADRRDPQGVCSGSRVPDRRASARWSGSILWQRVAGGFSAGQQRELALRVMGSLGIGGRKPPRINPQIERESWRLLASLERLDRDTRVRVGEELVARVRKEPRNGSLLWALGRLGARRPFYGPLDRTVPPSVAERWLDAMLAWPVLVPDAIGAIAQIATRVDNAALDIDEAHRAAVIELLAASGASSDLMDAVQHARDGSSGTRCDISVNTLPVGLRVGPG